MEEIGKIREVILEVARRCADQGPGFAQEAVVLRQAADRLGISRDLRAQQRLLNVWSDLFKEGILYWGYDINNPGQPFYHFPESEPAKARVG